MGTGAWNPNRNYTAATTTTYAVYILDLSDIESCLACEYAFHKFQEKLSYISLLHTPKNTTEEKRLECIQSLVYKSILLNGEASTKITTSIPLDTNIRVIICGCNPRLLEDYADKIIEENNGLYHISKHIVLSGGAKLPQTNDSANFEPISNRIIQTKNTKSLKRLLEVTQQSLAFGEVWITGDFVLMNHNNTSTGLLWRNDDLLQALCNTNRYTTLKNAYLRNCLLAIEGLSILTTLQPKYLSYSASKPIFHNIITDKKEVATYTCMISYKMNY